MLEPFLLLVVFSKRPFAGFAKERTIKKGVVVRRAAKTRRREGARRRCIHERSFIAAKGGVTLVETLRGPREG